MKPIGTAFKMMAESVYPSCQQNSIDHRIFKAAQAIRKIRQVAIDESNALNNAGASSDHLNFDKVARDILRQKGWPVDLDSLEDVNLAFELIWSLALLYNQTQDEFSVRAHLNDTQNLSYKIDALALLRERVQDLETLPGDFKAASLAMLQNYNADKLFFARLNKPSFV